MFSFWGALALLCGACLCLACVLPEAAGLGTQGSVLFSTYLRGSAQCQAQFMFVELVGEGILFLWASYSCGPLTLSVEKKNVNYSA